MLKFIESLILTFIPIFVAVDSLGNIPLFISLVEGMNNKQRQRVITESVTTATLIAIIFVFVGKPILRFIGISVADFQIAGGLLILVISINLLLGGRTKFLTSLEHERDVGIFPLGTPLITGPAVLTTILMMVDTFGIIPTFFALIINMFIAWFTMVKSDMIIRFMGVSGVRAFSKITYILLASIGIMMIRKGLQGILLR
ncbi:MAG: MarC family protein [Candidatus Omnitrophica bacterium]|nr:MarC family protein [Candidatus Omnitrophota bacterium]MCM8799673.1 MarC family protein [Candidatus Omnitrophota bacterium]